MIRRRNLLGATTGALVLPCLAADQRPAVLTFASYSDVNNVAERTNQEKSNV